MMSELKDSQETKPFRPARRQYFVNPRFQGRFIEILCVLALVIAVVSALAVFRTVKGVLLDVMYRSHLPGGTLWQLIWPSLVQTNLMLATISFLLSALVISHVCRRAEKSLRAVEEEVCSLDSAPHYASALDTLEPRLRDAGRLVSKSLQKRMQAFVDAADTLQTAAARWEKMVRPGGWQEERSQMVAELEMVVKMVEETTGRFRY